MNITDFKMMLKQLSCGCILKNERELSAFSVCCVLSATYGIDLKKVWRAFQDVL